MLLLLQPRPLHQRLLFLDLLLPAPQPLYLGVVLGDDLAALLQSAADLSLMGRAKLGNSIVLLGLGLGQQRLAGVVAGLGLRVAPLPEVRLGPVERSLLLFLLQVLADLLQLGVAAHERACCLPKLFFALCQRMRVLLLLGLQRPQLGENALGAGHGLRGVVSLLLQLPAHAAELGLRHRGALAPLGGQPRVLRLGLLRLAGRARAHGANVRQALRQGLGVLRAHLPELVRVGPAQLVHRLVGGALGLRGEGLLLLKVSLQAPQLRLHLAQPPPGPLLRLRALRLGLAVLLLRP
mmetsp:Transcript_38560/g.100472  ORF Transcript_38560/g.100472 Transcript_38560/m.100472 type:complete len:294 (-) Transcript_38560:787-1668(-)